MAASDMITLDAARQHLNMSDDSAAAELAVHISAASELVEQFTGPVVIRQFVERQVGDRLAGLVLRYRPVVALVSVTPSFTGDPVEVAELVVHPTRGDVTYESGAWLLGGPFDVVYTAGRAASVDDVPGALALACRVIVAHLWETQRAVTLGGPGLAADDFTATPVGAGFAVPYRARDLLAPYMSPLIA